MKHASLRIVPVLLLAACHPGHRASATVTTTTSGGTSRTEVHLSGDSNSVEANGDKIEVRAGEVWINGKSHGPVESGQDVLYVAEDGPPVLTVDGHVRETVGG